MSGRTFDIQYARAYARKMFGGFHDTIGEQYVCEAMRRQWENDNVELACVLVNNGELKTRINELQIVADGLRAVESEYHFQTQRQIPALKERIAELEAENFELSKVGGHIAKITALEEKLKVATKALKDLSGGYISFESEKIANDALNKIGEAKS